MIDVINQIRSHCTAQVAGPCATCPTRDPCRETLLDQVDRLFAAAHDRWSGLLAQDRLDRMAGVSPQRQAARHLIDELSIVVLQADRVDPIKTIDAVRRVAHPFATPEPNRATGG